MTLPDLINGGFEIFAAGAVLHHCAVLQRARLVAGVSFPAVVFFTLWGLWNLYYYPHLSQPLSFIGGIFITLANLYYLALLWRYRRVV